MTSWGREFFLAMLVDCQTKRPSESLEPKKNSAKVSARE